MKLPEACCCLTLFLQLQISDISDIRISTIVSAIVLFFSFFSFNRMLDFESKNDSNHSQHIFTTSLFFYRLKTFIIARFIVIYYKNNLTYYISIAYN